METSELKEAYWGEVVDNIQDELIHQYGYIEEFEDLGNCTELWQAYCKYLEDQEVDDHCKKAVELWINGRLDEYLEGDCPPSPRK